MHNVETLNKLLKDEISATETYHQVFDKLCNDTEGLGGSEFLVPIHEAHQDAAFSLQALIQRMGGTPFDDSGIWGIWVKIVQGGANLLGRGIALKALQGGEKNGAEDYEEALQDTELPSDARALIETKLLPAQQSHIRLLGRVLETETP